MVVDKRMNHDRGKTKVIPGPSKNMAEAMRQISGREKFRLQIINDNQREYLDTVAYIRCAAQTRNRGIILATPSDFVLKRLRCVDGFRTEDMGGGNTRISW